MFVFTYTTTLLRLIRTVKIFDRGSLCLLGFCFIVFGGFKDFWAFWVVLPGLCVC